MEEISFTLHLYSGTHRADEVLRMTQNVLLYLFVRLLRVRAPANTELYNTLYWQRLCDECFCFLWTSMIEFREHIETSC